jgi:TetR/AcrR family transcriptional repressor of mexJK operon
MTRGSGRPVDLEKRQAILDAARRLFAERGIDGCPIEAIAAASDVSKVTVYRHFGEKGGIFEALVAREIDRLAERIGEIGSSGGPLRDRLVGFGKALIAMLSDPEHLDLETAVALEATRNPDVARRFYDAGPGRVHAILADVLAAAAARGEVDIANPMDAAQDLMSLWFGLSAIQGKFRLAPWPTESLAAHMDRTTDLFLRAVAPAAR